MDARLVELRAQFPALDGGLRFFDWAATGLIPETTRRALAAWADELAECPSGEATWIHGRGAETRNDARRLIAAALNADAKDVALVESTTAGLNLAAAAIRMPEGSNVILSECDYLAVATPWKHRARRDKIELRWVAPRGAWIHVDDLLERIDEKTRVIAISTIGWTTGALLDVVTLAREARMRGILLLLDAIQTFGVVPLDLKAAPAAFVACGGHKWLNAPLGAGFLHVHPEIAARHQPPFVGFLSGRAPRGNWFDWFVDPASRPDEEVLFPATGRSFETGGTPCYPGALGLRESLSLTQGLGDVVLAHVRDLGTHLIGELDRLGFGVVTPRSAAERAGMIVFNAPGGAAAEQALVRSLRERRIVTGVRYSAGLGGIRAALHGMNTRDDVDCLADALAKLRP